MIDTILLGLIAAGVSAHVAIVARPARPSRSENPAVPAAAEPATSQDGGPTENDLRIEALIQRVDPSWHLGDDRDHVTLVPDANGTITEARLR